MRRRQLLGTAALALGVALLVGALARSDGRHPRPHPAATRAAERTRRPRATPSQSSATVSDGRAQAAVRGGAPAGAVEESAEVRHLIALGRPIYCAPRRGDEVALTFDDGPGPYTRKALRKLRKHGASATFFVVGRNIALVPRATREERALGAVGDHTFTHPLLTSLSPAQAERQIASTQSLLARASGGPVFLFRPPYGAHDARIDAIARAHGLLQILWTVDSADSLGASYAQIERNVIAGLRPGAIILMHENHGQTIRALLAIFTAIARKHLRAVSVPQLLSDDPPRDAQVRAGGLGCGARASSARGGG